MTIGSSVFGNALRTIIWGGLGLVLLFGGIYFITTENAPECGGQSMQRGDECVGTRSGVRDFDEMKHADRTMGYVLAGFGSVLTLITGAGLLEDFRRRNLITVSDASLLSADEMAAITAMISSATSTSIRPTPRTATRARRSVTATTSHRSAHEANGPIARRSGSASPRGR